MINSKLAKIPLSLGVSLCIGLISTTAFSANIDLFKLDQNHNTTDGTSFKNLEGFLLVIKDTRKVKFTIPKLGEFDVACDSLDNSFSTARQFCVSGIGLTCKQVYNFQNGIYKPTSRSDDLVPMKPVINYVNHYHNKNTNKKVVGINLGFFDLTPFPNRSTNQSVWKPLYQEACGLNLGTLYSNENKKYYSHFGDKEKLPSGVDDAPFSTLIIHSNGDLDDSKRFDIEPRIKSKSLAFSGVLLRRNGVDRGEIYLPKFVQDKASSAVARTAVGYKIGEYKMKFLVVQGGRASGAKGLTIDDVKKFFAVSDGYDSVMLLDGSGSSQLAANFSASTIQSPTTTGRTNCIHKNVKTCTLKGDVVGNAYVSHWNSKYKTPYGNYNSSVDRRTPNVLLVID
ncbi:phosphodiester glycosidase family protein [Pseudoalteromonas piscicida]|nr:phosphodiester glycosidase family protein [Pseudoalteromonas piscicida]